MVRWRNSQDLPLIGRPSALGVAVGAVLFAASLTPSMIPRSGLMQGVLGGLCLAVGYMIGYALITLFDWMMERSPPGARQLRRNMRLALVVAVIAALWALWNVTGWQNGIHRVMGMPPVESARPLTILATALALGGVLVLIGRLFRRIWRVMAAQLEGLFPRRLALGTGLVLAFLLFWMVGNDVVLQRVLTTLDETYSRIDRLIPDDTKAPQNPMKSGSAASLVDWPGLGAEGRNWVLDLPDAAQIADVTGTPAMEPLRVYVGLNNAETARERARLALDEAIRVGAFSRKVLVIATPTGTGWMDPAGVRPLEYLTDGDVATVAVQYSYLPSWLSLMVQPEYGAETASETFAAIYTHWHSLPKDSRPRLYLFGLSLGARNGEIASAVPELLGDPMQGAFWVGPPFAAGGWRQILAGRQPDSPPWSPRFRDGSVIRTMTQSHELDRAERPWGPVRMVYLAYPSDPIAFFSTDVLWRQPDWLNGDRGPDVSPGFRWFPVVTFLQLGFDMMTATTTPTGYGHVYAARDYLVGWNEVLGAPADAARLQAIGTALAGQGL